MDESAVQLWNALLPIDSTPCWIVTFFIPVHNSKTPKLMVFILAGIIISVRLKHL